MKGVFIVLQYNKDKKTNQPIWGFPNVVGVYDNLEAAQCHAIYLDDSFCIIDGEPVKSEFSAQKIKKD